MAEYIERGATYADFEKRNAENPKWTPSRVKSLIARQPAADVAPVRHGRWIDKNTGRYGQKQSWCSVCGKHSGIGGIESNRHKPYCPNCGARMDGDG